MSKDLTELLKQASGQGGAQPSSSTYQPKTLPNVPNLPPIPPRVGSAIAQLPVAAEGGESGDGSFEELDASLRQYWNERTLMTADGLFTLTVRPIRQMALVGGGFAKFDAPAGDQ